VSEPPQDESCEWHVYDTDDPELIGLAFDDVSLDGVETYDVELSPAEARKLAAALIEFADALE